MYEAGDWVYCWHLDNKDTAYKTCIRRLLNDKWCIVGRKANGHLYRVPLDRIIMFAHEHGPRSMKLINSKWKHELEDGTQVSETRLERM